MLLLAHTIGSCWEHHNHSTHSRVNSIAAISVTASSDFSRGCVDPSQPLITHSSAPQSLPCDEQREFETSMLPS